MEEIAILAVAVIGIFLLLKIIALPMKLFFKILINSASGFVCLWLLNAISGFTGLHFAVNFITTLIVGTLGLPGVVLLALAQFLI